jgi:hypothetical protein
MGAECIEIGRRQAQPPPRHTKRAWHPGRGKPDYAFPSLNRFGSDVAALLIVHPLHPF